jgi:recombinational DNA repair protein RecR
MKVKITKLAQGISVGMEVSFADDGSLIAAFKNRSPVVND